jgi:hypothetical protein
MRPPHATWRDAVAPYQLADARVVDARVVDARGVGQDPSEVDRLAFNQTLKPTSLKLREWGYHKNNNDWRHMRKTNKHSTAKVDHLSEKKNKKKRKASYFLKTRTTWLRSSPCGSSW